MSKVKYIEDYYRCSTIERPATKKEEENFLLWIKEEKYLTKLEGYEFLEDNGIFPYHGCSITYDKLKDEFTLTAQFENPFQSHLDSIEERLLSMSSKCQNGEEKEVFSKEINILLKAEIEKIISKFNFSDEENEKI